MNTNLLARAGCGLTALIWLSLAGCGDNYQGGTGFEASTTKTTPSPGYVRIVNLTDSPVQIRDRGRPITSDLAAGASSDLLPLGVGDVRLQIGPDSADTVNVQLKSKLGATTILFPGKKQSNIPDEIRYADGKRNLRVEIFDDAGNRQPDGTKVTVAGPDGPVVLESGKTTSGALGTYNAEGSGFTNSSSMELQDKFAYTFLFVGKPGHYAAFLLRNADNTKPAAGQASST